MARHRVLRVGVSVSVPEVLMKKKERVGGRRMAI